MFPCLYYYSIVPNSNPCRLPDCGQYATTVNRSWADLSNFNVITSITCTRARTHTQKQVYFCVEGWKWYQQKDMEAKTFHWFPTRLCDNLPLFSSLLLGWKVYLTAIPFFFQWLWYSDKLHPHDKKPHLSDHHLTNSLFCNESNIAAVFIYVVYNDVVILFLYDGLGNELSRLYYYPQMDKISETEQTPSSERKLEACQCPFNYRFLYVLTHYISRATCHSNDGQLRDIPCLTIGQMCNFIRNSMGLHHILKIKKKESNTLTTTVLFQPGSDCHHPDTGKEKRRAKTQHGAIPARTIMRAD